MQQESERQVNDEVQQYENRNQRFCRWKGFLLYVVVGFSCALQFNHCLGSLSQYLLSMCQGTKKLYNNNSTAVRPDEADILTLISLKCKERKLAYKTLSRLGFFG